MASNEYERECQKRRAKNKLFAAELGVFAFSGLFAFLSFGLAKNLKSEYDYKKAAEEYALINGFVFDEVYENYNSYIDLICTEIKNTDMNNSAVEVFSCYKLLESNGLISVTDDFKYGCPPFEPFGNEGIAVALGQGVCRNEAANLYHIFDKLGYECGIVSGELYEGAKPEGKANHQVVFVRFKGINYLFDPTNKTVFVRDVLGFYRSIDFDLKFDPSMIWDNRYNELTTTLPLYISLSDNYSSSGSLKREIGEADYKAMCNYDYYVTFEGENLQHYENAIVDELDEYDAEVQEVLDSLNENDTKYEYKYVK